MESRPPIPAELKRKVLVEAGHRCAIPTCRHVDVDIHHIKPWEKCKKHEYENLIALCPNCHSRADSGKIDRKSLRMYKNNLRYIYDRFTVFEIDILEEFRFAKEDEQLIFPSFFELLIKRIIDAGFVELIVTKSFHSVGGLKMNPNYLRITSSGRDFLNDISSKDIGY